MFKVILAGPATGAFFFAFFCAKALSRTELINISIAINDVGALSAKILRVFAPCVTPRTMQDFERTSLARWRVKHGGAFCGAKINCARPNGELATVSLLGACFVFAFIRRDPRHC